MNCTYKINVYHIPFLIMSGIISLNISFYGAFCFINDKTQKDYAFVMKHLKNLYRKFDFPDSELVLIDDEQALINTLSIEFSHMSNLLCMWHINQNVTTQF